MVANLPAIALFIASYFVLTYFIGSHCIVFVGLLIAYVALFVGVSRS